jgi:hypothetical protein
MDASVAQWSEVLATEVPGSILLIHSPFRKADTILWQPVFAIHTKFSPCSVIYVTWWWPTVAEICKGDINFYIKLLQSMGLDTHSAQHLRVSQSSVMIALNNALNCTHSGIPLFNAHTECSSIVGGLCAWTHTQETTFWLLSNPHISNSRNDLMWRHTIMTYCFKQNNHLCLHDVSKQLPSILLLPSNRSRT